MARHGIQFDAAFQALTGNWPFAWQRRLFEIIDHREDQVLFVDLGPVEGRGDRVITALGKPYSPIDSPCIVVDGE